MGVFPEQVFNEFPNKQQLQQQQQVLQVNKCPISIDATNSHEKRRHWEIVEETSVRNVLRLFQEQWKSTVSISALENYQNAIFNDLITGRLQSQGKHEHQIKFNYTP